MLAKFEQLPLRVEDDDPRLRLMAGWADYTGLLRDNTPRIQRALGDVMARHAMRRADPEANFAVDVEAALSNSYPELILALNSMRSALDRMVGWPIAWRQRRFGDIVGAETYIDDSEQLIAQNLRRAPAQFDPLAGFIVGNRIGADPIMMSIGTWVEIATDVGQRGALHALGDMHAIEIRTPEEGDRAALSADIPDEP